MESHRWFRERQLAAQWGGEDRIPAAIVCGIAIYDAALNAVQVHDMREEQRRREREAEAHAQQAPPIHAGRPRLPPPRKRRR